MMTYAWVIHLQGDIGPKGEMGYPGIMVSNNCIL